MSHEPDLGSLLRSYRMRSGLTQEELATRAGLSIRGLRDLERGRSRRPHLASIHRLAEAIGLSPAERAPLLERTAGPGGRAGGAAWTGTEPLGTEWPGSGSPGPGGVVGSGLPGSALGAASASVDGSVDGAVVGSVGGAVVGSVGWSAAWPAAGLVTGSPTVGILGPLMVVVDAQPLRPGTPMLRVVLGLLALYAPDPVPLDEIMAEIWGDHPPRTARGQVHVRIGQLRRLLNPPGLPGTGTATTTPDPIESVNGGYRLRTALDASTFYDLVETADRALAANDPAGARAHYAQALRLWRGPALSDVAALRSHPAVAGLTHRRVTATIAYGALVGSADPADRAGVADRAAGDRAGGEEAVRWLRALAADEPLHEGLAASLILTLAAGGEHSAALAVYDAMRDRLREELGIDPGPELRAAHLRVLRQETGS